MYSLKQEFVACMSLNGMVSSKRCRKLALYPVCRDLSTEDNNNASGDSEKDNNSLRLMSSSANSRATKSLLNMSLSASAFLVFDEIFDVFVENVFNFFLYRIIKSYFLCFYSVINESFL